MAYFPQFSNFKDYVQAKLNSRKDNSIGVSQLNVWVRLTSGVGDGLVMTSNPDYQLFRAAGASTGIYDGAGGNATIGVDWNGKSVSAGGGNLLRPSPVVTSVEVDEGAGGISRKATISITAFTLEQMETVCEYFLEPGYTVFLEFGWNTSDSATGLVTINTSNVAGMQNFDKVNKKRETSNGDYENYLGYITGGSVSFDDGKWTITTNLTGFVELPFYLQTHKSQLAGGVSGSIVDSSTLNYLASNIEAEKDYGRKAFKIMFNDLPAERKNQSVRNLENYFERDYIFINFDDEIKNAINEKFGTIKPDGTGGFRERTTSEAVGETLGISSLDSGVSFDLESEGVKIVGDERFIRLGNLMQILTAATMSSFKLADGTDVSLNFDISQTVISSHKHIFSTDKSKLFIPNQDTPKFSLEDETTGFVNNSIGPIKFPQNIACPESGIQKDAYEWGYLKDLYINFDFAKDIIGTTNLTIKDVIYQILNGASSAVNSQWDFQIQEAPLKNGVINLQIVDLNLVSKTDNANIYEFSVFGNNSIFIDSSFSMELGGAMMNKIIGERVGINANPDLYRPGIFTDKNDKILNEVNRNQKITIDPPDGTPAASDPTEVTIQARLERIASNSTGITAAILRGTAFVVGAVVANEARLVATRTDAEAAEVEEEAKKEAVKQRISQFFGKISYYPKVGIKKDDITEPDIDFLCYAAVYDDTVLLDGYKQNTQNNNSQYSPILPITFSFTIHGISGIQRGDKFKVKGIPKTFYERGFFQVTSVKHTVDGMMWKTSVEGAYRNIL